jgi:hypothetical protein
VNVAGVRFVSLGDLMLLIYDVRFSYPTFLDPHGTFEVGFSF